MRAALVLECPSRAISSLRLAPVAAASVPPTCFRSWKCRPGRPAWPGSHALVELGGLVCFEGCDERGRERNSAPALVRLNFVEVEPAAGSLRARPGKACTAGQVVVAMTALGADIGIGAAVLPGEALKLPADGQCSGLQVDVLPPKTKGFTLAQPECEGDTPAGAVSPRCSQP